MDHKTLTEVLDYDPKTGIFIWKIDANARKKKGSRAGFRNSGSGYRHICIFKERFVEHRVAWFYVHGKWPEHEIDHIDRRRYNNAIDNLREATRMQQNGNWSPRSNNTSGVRGVVRSGNFWVAYITDNYKKKNLGYFPDRESAHAAYVEAARKKWGHFFTPQFC
jgi:hypothetical protein